MYDAQIPILQSKATEKYFQGLQLCGFEREKIPVIKEVNQRLKASTGWEVFIVPGLIDDKPFFEFLAASGEGLPIALGRPTSTVQYIHSYRGLHSHDFCQRQ